MDYKQDFFDTLLSLGSLPKNCAHLEVKYKQLEEEKQQVEEILAHERKPVDFDISDLSESQAAILLENKKIYTALEEERNKNKQLQFSVDDLQKRLAEAE